MAGQGKSARACDAWTKRQFTELLLAFLKKRCQSLLNIRIMSLIICKQDFVIVVDYGDFNGCGTDIDSESVVQIHTSRRNSSYLLCKDDTANIYYVGYWYKMYQIAIKQAAHVVFETM